ncbi:MAG TPA: AsmA-like C-terminal region-containing protein [Salinimicrobium sp.]|nr:AsmA-like C-terminal region-containing protein [Salinimicrobium sp.]
MKKALKIIGITLLVIFIFILIAPFIFEKQMVDYVKKTVNENLNATVAFTDTDLSFIRNFPQASLSLENLSVINNEPFEGDTLFFAENVSLNMSIKELFNSAEEPMKVNDFQISDAVINIKIDSLGNSNYDIAIKEDAPVEDESKPSSGFSFDVQHYEIADSEVNYIDKGGKIYLKVEDFDHQGTGNFAAAVSDLSTHSSGLISFNFDGTQYLERNAIKLDADFKMDLENQKYTFLENEAVINQLPLTFNGFIEVNEDHNFIDISFKTPSSSFKNFLAVMPKEYSKNIENVATEGEFIVTGFLNGRVDETYIPKLDIKIASENASFKYPDLPKAVRNINIDAQIKNETGLAEDTYISIDDLKFSIDQDRFEAKGKVRNLTENMLVDLDMNGTINLANLKQAYPLEMEQDLNGILTADVNTSFDMESLEKEQYQNVKSNGTASITNFKYKAEAFPNEIVISEAKIDFQPSTVNLEKMEATTGQTDMMISGTLKNLMGYLFTDQELKGNFNITSNTFAVADVMQTETDAPASKNKSTQTTSTGNVEGFKMPDFLDATINVSADRVLYDNLVLENTKGTIIIKDQAATLSNVTSNIFDGAVALTGNVSTKGQLPEFKMGLQLSSLNISETLNNLDLFEKLAPVAKALEGVLNLQLDLQGNLNNDLTPNLQTLAGNALAKVVTAEINPKQSTLLSKLDERLGFLDLENLNLDNLETYLTFNNGAVEIKPFDFNIKGINVTAAGKHNFDMNMDYDFTLEVPARYLGGDVAKLLNKLSAQDAESMTVNLPVDVTGTFQSPRINLNTEQAVTQLTTRIIEKQKEELKEKGKDILSGLLGGNSGNNNNSTPQDSTATNTTTTPTKENEVKDAVKDILGGLLGGKKKDPKDNKE